MTLGMGISDDENRTELTKQPWDINDSKLPTFDNLDQFEHWPNGHCRYVYPANEEEARRHTSGWAMRNTNNHNVNILKKSCLGVFLCSRHCTLNSGRELTIRPAICDKARKKQSGKPCPNPKCDGVLTLKLCKGHCGYPVTHFWRQVGDAIYFQAKGSHDHHPPDSKPSGDNKRARGREQRLKRRWMREESHCFGTEIIKPKIGSGAQMCSCPPFECFCSNLPILTESDDRIMPFSKLSEDLSRRQKSQPPESPLLSYSSLLQDQEPQANDHHFGARIQQQGCPPYSQSQAGATPSSLGISSPVTSHGHPKSNCSSFSSPHMLTNYDNQQVEFRNLEFSPDDPLSGYMNTAYKIDFPEPEMRASKNRLPGFSSLGIKCEVARSQWQQFSSTATSKQPELMELGTFKTEPELLVVSHTNQRTYYTSGNATSSSDTKSAFQPYTLMETASSASSHHNLAPIASSIYRPFPLHGDSYFRYGLAGPAFDCQPFVYS